MVIERFLKVPGSESLKATRLEKPPHILQGHMFKMPAKALLAMLKNNVEKL